MLQIKNPRSSGFRKEEEEEEDDDEERVGQGKWYDVHQKGSQPIIG